MDEDQELLHTLRLEPGAGALTRDDLVLPDVRDRAEAAEVLLAGVERDHGDILLLGTLERICDRARVRNGGGDPRGLAGDGRVDQLGLLLRVVRALGVRRLDAERLRRRVDAVVADDPEEVAGAVCDHCVVPRRRRLAGGGGRGRHSHEAGARHEHAAPEEEVASAEPVLLLVVLLVELDVILVAHVPFPFLLSRF